MLGECCLSLCTNAGPINLGIPWQKKGCADLRGLEQDYNDVVAKTQELDSLGEDAALSSSSAQDFPLSPRAHQDAARFGIIRSFRTSAGSEPPPPICRDGAQ